MMYVLESLESKQFAGESVTLSFRAFRGANAPTTLTAVVYYGTGTDQAGSAIWSGWTGGTIASTTNLTIGTSIASYSVTASIPSSATQIAVYFEHTSTGTAGANEWFQLETVQLEAGTSATPFRRNANSLQGELAACQRYYVRFIAQTTGEQAGVVGGNLNQTMGQAVFPTPSTLRSSATSIDFANIGWLNFANVTTYSGGSITLQSPGNSMGPSARYTHGSSVLTTGNSGAFAATTSPGFIGFSAEL
jgi:hypothetical protein